MSAPASWEILIRRADSTSQLAWSQTSPAAWQASHSQRSCSSVETSAPRKAATARLSSGAPAANPCVISTASPSSSRSGGRAGPGGGAARAAQATSRKPPP